MAAALQTRLRNLARRVSASAVSPRTVRMVNTRPIASFTFDDFPKSAATRGAEILEGRGFRGTYYLSARFQGLTEDGIDYYDRGDIVRLSDYGHEIGCHTASHVHVPDLGRKRLEGELAANAAFVRETLGDVRMTTFAFPFGDIDLRTKLFMQDRFAACRTTSAGVNHSVADLGGLRAISIYSGSTDAERIRAIAREAATPRSWLIFYTHDVSETPSAFGCTPQLLQAATDAVAEAGFDVLPVRNALGLIRFRA
ncbi:MAG TPA: polysaccharide deacetylase family protein [Caulobacteraceae bacterium]|jgi:peptidoglycan/xylan/chitin deacetylase (PgdA/CDA1 family)|nr:polysaccharide deacetylase family protein [Caulobacteraceae bacterium]